MKLSSIFAAGTLLAGAFVLAAPTVGSAASIVKRNEAGYDVIDFDYVIRTVRDINTRYANKDAKSLQKRDDTEFIDQLILELHNHDLLNDFILQLTDTPRLKEAVEEGVTSAISEGMVNETTLLTSLRRSGKLSTFFDSVLNDEDLNDELYNSAREILQKAEENGVSRRALTESSEFLGALYADSSSPRVKRSLYEEELMIERYGMSKRALLDSIISIVEEIYDSGFVQDIIKSIIGNQSLVSYVINLFVKIFKSIDWSSLFNTIKNSGIIQRLFSALLNFISGLFSGSSLSSLIEELFGGSSNSTHKSFLASLLSVGVEIGQDLFGSLTKSNGFLSELLDTLLNGTSSSTSSSSSSSSGGSLSSLLSSLFGGSTSGLSTSSSKDTSSSSDTSSGGGLLSSLFESIFGSSDSSESSSSSSSSNSSGSSGLSSIIDSLFGGSSSLSSTVKSSSSSSVFSNKKACCCSPQKIKKRALKRALKKKMKRSVKRTLSFETPEMKAGLMNFFFIK